MAIALALAGVGGAAELAATPVVRAILMAADLGATAIDVSDYPAEHQRTYQDLFLTKCAICHTPARALNAQYLELPAAQSAALKRAHPESTWNPDVLSVGPGEWKKYITKMWRRPPCCSVCPTFTQAEAQAIWHFLVYDSIRRKSGDHVLEWARYRLGLLETFKHHEEQAG
jgi:hypothetical protein